MYHGRTMHGFQNNFFCTNINRSFHFTFHDLWEVTKISYISPRNPGSLGVENDIEKPKFGERCTHLYWDLSNAKITQSVKLYRHISISFLFSRFIYLFLMIKLEREREIFICWFIPQVAARVRDGPQ